MGNDDTTRNVKVDTRLNGPQVSVPHNNSTVIPEAESPEVMPFEGVEKKYPERRNISGDGVPAFDRARHANYGSPVVSAKSEEEENLEAIRDAREALRSMTETEDPHRYGGYFPVE